MHDISIAFSICVDRYTTMHMILFDLQPTKPELLKFTSYRLLYQVTEVFIPHGFSGFLFRVFKPNCKSRERSHRSDQPIACDLLSTVRYESIKVNVFELKYCRICNQNSRNYI